MTNPDNVGGLVWYVCTSCLLMVQLPSDTPTLGRCQCSPKGWSLRRAKLPKGYELCRAAPAGGDAEVVRLRQLLAGTQEQFRVVSELLERNQAHHERMMKLMDSAPAGSGEVDALCQWFWDNAMVTGDVTGSPDDYREHAIKLLAFLRKLQQGADKTPPCQWPNCPCDQPSKGCGPND